MAAQLPTLYTLQDLHDRYGWSVDTLYDYIRSGQLPAAKVGRTYYVDADAVAALIANRAAVPGNAENDD